MQDTLETPERIDRHILSDEIVFSGKNKDRLVELTNQWKHLLYGKYGCNKGELVALSILSIDEYHLSAIIACAELGLKLILFDAPATEESLPFTKIALHGPADYCIHTGTAGDDLYGGLHGKMIRRYSHTMVDQAELIGMPISDIDMEYKVYPRDDFLVSSTSGTTKPSRPVIFTQQDVYRMSKRNVDIFEFRKDTPVIHSKNLHHASAMITSLIPSLMASDQHATIPIGETVDWDMFGTDIVENIENGGYTRIMIPNEKTLRWFLDSVDKTFGWFTETLLINMCGFTIGERFTEYCSQYNVEFISHYGSIDTAIPLLVNRVTRDSEYVPMSLGVLPDDHYKVTLTDERAMVECEWWKEPRYMDDVLELRDGQYILKGRINHTETLQEIMEAFPDINLDLFFQDTKINMEQLRGHVSVISKWKRQLFP